MPRGANGTYTLPPGNPVVSGTVIDSIWANTTMADLAIEMTDSLSRSGKGGMLVSFQNFDGTESLPGITWASEPQTGFYRPTVGDQRMTLQGTDLMRWNAGVVSIWSAGAWHPVHYQGSAGTLPPGTGNDQSLRWDAPSGAWIPSVNHTIDENGNVVATAFTGDGSNLTDLPVTPPIWGLITGTLSDQLDLQAALDAAGTAAAWGTITGTLSAQLDLQAALDLKNDVTAFTAHTTDLDIHYPDAPNDGGLYGRRNLVWVQSEGLTYSGYVSDPTSDLEPNVADAWADYGTRNAVTRALGNVILFNWPSTTTDAYQYVGNDQGPMWVAGSNEWIPLGGSGTVWGQITGTLANQTDLQSAIDAAAVTVWGPIGGTLADQTDLQAALDAAALTVWGGIGGTLSNQTDLQSALDAAGTAPAWGQITGTLANQIDLQAALDLKATVSALTAHTSDAVIHFIDVPAADGIRYIRSNRAWVADNSQPGDVVGPAGASADNITAFDTGTGKLIKDSGISTANLVTLTVGGQNADLLHLHAGADAHIATSNIHFVDAPLDGAPYVRQSATWVAAAGLTYVGYVSDATSDLEPTVEAGWNELADRTGITRGLGEVLYFRWLGTSNDVYQYLGSQTAAPWTSTAGEWALASSSPSVWGNITGTLADQTDLQAALDLKAEAATLTAHTSNTDIHFADVANDSIQYIRINKGWAVNSSAVWGQITGTLTNQADLNSALGLKTDNSAFSAHTGNVGIHFTDAPNDSLQKVRFNGAWVTNSVATWGQVNGTLSAQTDLQNALNLKANAADTVNLTGNQTVAGVKTFSASPIVPNPTTATQATNKGTVDAQVALKADALVALSTQTASYTLVAADAGKLVTMNNAGANTLTIPANATVAFAIGTRIELSQLGAGQTTVAILTDTLNSKGGLLALTAQFSGATLTKTAATTWLLVGDLA